MIKLRSICFWISATLAIAVFPDTLTAQLLTQGGFTAADLVQNTLLGGGVQVSNITFQGSNGAIGTFDGTNTNIGLSTGVIMTTGVISGPNGPQGPNNVAYSGVDNGSPGAPFLMSAFNLPEPTFNATIITFNFIPSGDSINFRYVFGSEEYKEYVGSEFNDVFGFFITGPNPVGTAYNNTNIAVLPGSNTKVTINNVNHLLNSNYYVDNESPQGQTIQYDGFTRVLTAKAAVVPCSTYTIRMAIADVGDGIYDSGVFLEAKSFSSEGAEISAEIVNSFAKDSLYESCGEALVTIKRSNTNNNTDYTVNLNVLGSATNGVDYTGLPGTVTIPAGQDSIVLVLTPVFDGIPEGQENIIIEIDDPNLCPGVDPPKVTIPLFNVDPLTVVAMNDTAFDCNNELVFLTATATGGAGNLTYVWTPDAGEGNPFPVIAEQTTTFTITVTDQCGNQVVTDQVLITVPNVPPLTLAFSPDTSICPGEVITLNASAQGGIGDLVYSWSSGQGNVSQITVNPVQTTVYSILIEDSCGNSIGKAATVNVIAPEADFTYHYKENSLIKFNSEVSEDVVAWNWDFGDGFSSTEENPEHDYLDTGYYLVTLVVHNQYGCTDTVRKLLYAYPDFVFFIPNTFTPNQNGLNDVFSGAGGGFTGYKMYIFDRWGQIVYETSDIKRGWPGTDKNDNPVQLGVYVYRVELVTPPGDVFYYTGKINLIR